MKIETNFLALEGRAHALGLNIRQMCKAAGVDRSTWDRWKKGIQPTRVDGWNQVVDTIERLEAEAAAKKLAQSKGKAA